MRGKIFKRFLVIASLIFAFTLFAATVPSTAHAAPKRALVGCGGSGCTGTDPYGTGCNVGDTTVGSPVIISWSENGVTKTARVRLFWSQACQTNWAVFDSFSDCHQLYNSWAIQNGTGKQENGPQVTYPTCATHSPQIYSPTYGVSACGNMIVSGWGNNYDCTPYM